MTSFAFHQCSAFDYTMRKSYGFQVHRLQDGDRIETWCAVDAYVVVNGQYRAASSRINVEFKAFGCAEAGWFVGFSQKKPLYTTAFRSFPFGHIEISAHDGPCDVWLSYAPMNDDGVFGRFRPLMLRDVPALPERTARFDHLLRMAEGQAAMLRCEMYHGWMNCPVCRQSYAYAADMALAAFGFKGDWQERLQTAVSWPQDGAETAIEVADGVYLMQNEMPSHNVLRCRNGDFAVDENDQVIGKIVGGDVVATSEVPVLR